MSKADEYRHKAENCERLAEKANTQYAEQKLRDVAHNWREMAVAAERQEAI